MLPIYSQPPILSISALYPGDSRLGVQSQLTGEELHRIPGRLLEPLKKRLATAPSLAQQFFSYNQPSK